MWLRRSTKNKEETRQSEADKRWTDREPTLDQGVYYLYLIIGLQVVFVFVIMGIIMFIGKVISTPAWVFLAMFAGFVASMVYIYRKAKKHFSKLRDSFAKTDNDYEISIMGGMLTMRIEHARNGAKLLEAPTQPSSEQVIDAETKEVLPVGKAVHLS